MSMESNSSELSLYMWFKVLLRVCFQNHRLHLDRKLIVGLTPKRVFLWLVCSRVYVDLFFGGFIFHGESIASRGIFTNQSKPNFYTSRSLYTPMFWFFFSLHDLKKKHISTAVKFILFSTNESRKQIYFIYFFTTRKWNNHDLKSLFQSLNILCLYQNPGQSHHTLLRNSRGLATIL